MSLPANTSYTLNSTTYVQEPTLVQLVAAVQALCTAVGHPEWLPATTSQTTGSTTYIDGPKLIDLDSALRHLNVITPTDTSYTIGSTTYNETWKLPDSSGGPSARWLDSKP
jgi:hypothetical protein